eukprot:TRINITY_DN56_c0_g2_i1.p1 TRINITY_DN56_c0_g2~~TRINITY_DN56_c0_g2_i1.p1  ORF type:complete len:834 (+),score=319.24 TRINITY_DN56_c0_g2_i1:132-2633(+)
MANGEEFKQFNVRMMKTSNPVTVMQRFAAYHERGQKFDPKTAIKRFGHMMAACRKLAGAVASPTRHLRPDFILVTGHNNGLVQIRNFDTGALVASARHFNDAPVTCLSVSNSYIFSAVDKSKGPGDAHMDVYVWDMNNLADVYMTLEGHNDRVTCIAVPSWNEETPVTGSVDKSIIVWNMKAGRRPVHVLQGHTMMVKFLVLSKNFIASGSTDQSLRLWSWDGKATDRVDNAHNGPIQYLAHGAMPDTLISACGGGVVRESLVDAELRLQPLWMSKQAKGQILDVACDDAVVATCSTESGNVGFYIRATKDTHTFQAHETTCRSLALDSVRTLLFTGADDGSIAVWNYSATLAENAAPTQVMRAVPHSSAITCILLDMDARGRWERIFSCSADQSIFVLDMVVDRDSYSRPLAEPVTAAVEIAPTGTLVTASGTDCHLWNIANMRHKSSDEGASEEGCLCGHKEAIAGIAFSKDNLRLITVGEDAMMLVWSIALYDEAGYQHEELFTKDGAYELRGPATCLSETHGDLVGVGLTKTQHSVVELMNYVTGERIVHFATALPTTKLCFVGEPEDGVSHVVVQMQDASVAMYDLDGAVLGTIAQPVESGLAQPQFLYWKDDSFSPPQTMILTTKGNLVKEYRIVLTGAKQLSEIRSSFVAKAASHITCCDVLRQTAQLHCVVGTDSGAFHVCDRNGQPQYTVTWDGATENHAANAGSVYRRPRRTSLCDLSEAQVGGDAPATAVSANLKGRYLVMGYGDGLCMVWDTANTRVIKRFFPHHSPLTRVFANAPLKRVVTASKAALRIEVLHSRDDRLADTPYEEELPARKSLATLNMQ